MAIKRRPLTPEQEIARRSRRSFMVLGAGAVAAVAGWEWLKPDLGDDDIKAPLRSVLNLNEKVVRSAIYSNNHLAPTFPVSAIGNLKVNGDVGLDETDPNFDHIDVTPLGGSAKPVAPVHQQYSSRDSAQVQSGSRLARCLVPLKHRPRLDPRSRPSGMELLAPRLRH